ncbi:NUDIX domain-containing protein [candidate division GN15 bacterium]|nr:NUDIX domain-containing protein [candidate division GN15 bacterium]
MRLPIQVGVFVVRPHGNSHQYLLLHRVLKRMSFWQPVTGGVELGEAVIDTARRELTEETGFDSTTVESTGFCYTFPVDQFFQSIYERPVHTITQHIFVAHVPDGAEPTLDPIEHDHYCWCSLDQALEKLYWWDDKEAIKRVEAFLLVGPVRLRT